MFKIRGRSWKRTLGKILEELSNSQFQKLLEHYLDKIPKIRKESLSRDQLPQLIMECYGEDKSITLIHKAMKDIPRMDEAVMNLLLPFVRKRKEMKRKEAEKRKLKENATMTKRKTSAARKLKVNATTKETSAARKLKKNTTTTQKKTSAARKLKKNTRPTQKKTSADVPPRRHAEKIGRSTAGNEDGPRGLQSFPAAPVQPWRITIWDLKRGDQLADKVLICKVVHKTDLLTYQTQDNVTKYFFYLGVTDETDSVKVMVYGNQHYQELKEGNYFLFHNVLVEGDMLKLTRRSSVSQTTAFAVPERLEMEACSLLSPQCALCSIAQAKMAADKATVSIKGTVIAIGTLSHVTSKVDNHEKEFQELTLGDGADSIVVCLWEAAIKRLARVSLGNVVKVTNVKKKCFFGHATLSSTVFTQILKDETGIGSVNATTTNT